MPVRLITFIRAKLIVVTIHCGMAEAVRDTIDLVIEANAESLIFLS